MKMYHNAYTLDVLLIFNAFLWLVIHETYFSLFTSTQAEIVGHTAATKWLRGTMITSSVSVSGHFDGVLEHWLSAGIHNALSPPCGRTTDLQVSRRDLSQFSETQADWCHLWTVCGVTRPPVAPPQGLCVRLAVFGPCCRFACSEVGRQGGAGYLLCVFPRVRVVLSGHLWVCCCNMCPSLCLITVRLGFQHIVFLCVWGLIGMKGVTDKLFDFLFKQPTGAFIKKQIFLQMLQSVFEGLLGLSWTTL